MLEVGVDDVQPALDESAEVGQGHLGLLALGAHGPDVGQGLGLDAVQVGAGQNAIEFVLVAWHHARWYSSGQGPGPLRPAGAYRYTARPTTEERGTGPNCRLSVLASRASPATSRVPDRRSTDATRLISTREGSLGSRTAMTSPGLGQRDRGRGRATTSTLSPARRAGLIEVPATSTRRNHRPSAAPAAAPAASAAIRRLTMTRRPREVRRAGAGGEADQQTPPLRFHGRTAGMGPSGGAPTRLFVGARTWVR